MILAIRREKHVRHVSGARSDDWQRTLYCVVVEPLRNDDDSKVEEPRGLCSEGVML